jgi:hypothetical protein
VPRGKIVTRRTVFLILVLLLVLKSTGAYAQSLCPESAVKQMIYDLQTGQLHTAFIAPQLLNAIMVQTGGTGKYIPLAQLGAPMSVQVIGMQPLPYGVVCGFRTQFHAVTLDWQMALQGPILVGLFFRNASGQSVPNPTPPIHGGGTGSGGSTTPQPSKPVPSDSTEGCKLYPELCP